MFWDFNHHLEHKSSVVRTLLCRAETVMSEPEDVTEEVNHIKKVLTVNGYKKWSFQIPKKKTREEDNPMEGPTAIKNPVCIPYVSGLSEHMHSVFKSHCVPSYHKPCNTLRSLLVSPNDKYKKEKQCGVVYSVKCSECDQEYVGKTSRMLGSRFREYADGNHRNSAIEEHTSSTCHHYTLDDTKILVKEDKRFPRKI